MNKPNKDSISLDLIGISSGYNGGASIFARTLLVEFIKTSNQKLRVILPESERLNYLELERFAGDGTTFHYFKSRDSFFSKVSFRIATRIIKNQWLLAHVQRLRWREAIDFIENTSFSCLTMSTYISFPLSGVHHYCTLHDIQEKALPKFFKVSEKSARDIQVKNTLKNVTGLQVSSNFVKDEIRKYYSSESKHINFKVIPEGYSSSELESAIPVNRQLIKPVRIVFPANYWPHKDHLTFFKAIASIKNEYELDVICTGSTFGKDAEINSILAHLGLGNIKFLGYVSREELINLYQSSHVVISCSMYESSSLPIIEGAVLGCIPVASNIAPHVEMSKRLTMELFKLGNSSDLARVLREVFGRIEKADNSIVNANSKVVKELAWESLIPQYLGMLQKDFKRGN